MKTTDEVAFYAYDKDHYLLAVRAGIPAGTALQHSLEFLETAQELLLLGPQAAHAVMIMVEAAHATITAAIANAKAPPPTGA